MNTAGRLALKDGIYLPSEVVNLMAHRDLVAECGITAEEFDRVHTAVTSNITMLHAVLTLLMAVHESIVDGVQEVPSSTIN